jgi:hypothetical protein
MMLFLFFLLNLILNSQSLEFNIRTNAKLLPHKYQILANFTLPKGPIYAKGWLKYTTFAKEEKNKPREFFKNMAFYEQMKNGVTLDLTATDEVGYRNIPDEEHFFFILTDTSMNILSARKTNLARTMDVLNIDDIANRTSCCEFQGGVVDHGDFLEGYCFQVKTFNQKKNKNVIWELCSDTEVGLKYI